MPKEIISVQHVRAGNHLRDFNLRVFAGERIFLIGVHGSGVSAVKQLLEGGVAPDEGRIHAGGRRADRYDEERARANGIYSVDPWRQLVPTLSVAENIFAVQRRARAIVSRYTRALAERETAELLKTVDLDCHPGMLVYNLQLYEQLQVCLAKAVRANARLIILDFMSHVLSFAERNRLKDLIGYLSDELDISVLFIDDKLTNLLDGVTKVVLVKKGTDTRVFYRDELRGETPDGLRYKITDALVDTPRARPGAQARGAKVARTHDGFELAGGSILGVYDALWDSSLNMLDYLARFLAGNRVGIAVEGRELRLDSKWMKRNRVAYIPESSSDLLIRNLPLADNLVAPGYPRVSSALGVLNNRMMQRMRRDFAEEFGVDNGVAQVDELSDYQRKALSIARWVYARYRVLLLENPLVFMDVDSASTVLRYIETLAGRDITCIMSSKSLQDLSPICDAIILAKNTACAGLYQREEFGRIEVEQLL